MVYVNNEEKLNRIRNEKDTFVIADFDRTLTTNQSDPSVGIIPKYIGGECLKQRQKTFNIYRPIELDYTLKKEVKEKKMKEWAKASFKLLSNYATEEIIKKSLENSNMHLRKGTKEFFKELYLKKIPVVIMSSGVGNIVEGFLKKESCIYTNTFIVSNFFEFEDEKAKIDIENLMSAANKKHERIPSKIREMIKKKKAGLLFGDLVEDLKMVKKEDLNKILTFGFLDTNIEENLEEFNKNFDIVLTDNEDFETIKEVLTNG